MKLIAMNMKIVIKTKPNNPYIKKGKNSWIETKQQYIKQEKFDNRYTIRITFDKYIFNQANMYYIL